MGHRPAISRPSQPTTSPCRPSSSSSSRRAASSPLPIHAFPLPCFADAPASSSPRLPLHGALPLWPLPLPSAPFCSAFMARHLRARPGGTNRAEGQQNRATWTPCGKHWWNYNPNEPFCSPNLISPLVFFTIHGFDCSPNV